ncbi:MAG TPA: ribose-phosphate diphosphokinase, partial [Candidatus Nanoarchaeia archaeon]|nr:ribose-phosphate diphosphokinase [Candidatus Nanoarchaeia archaeon]
MKKEVVACSGGKHLAKSISRNLKAGYSELKVKKFPDKELNIRFNKDIKNKKVVLVQSFFDNLNEKILETLFAFYTAKDLGAKKVELFSPYFPYFRQDKRFKSGEVISIEVISKLFKEFDKIYFVDPHLHRIKNLGEVFKNGKKLTSVNVISDYIKKKKIKNKVFVGPDVESEQWAKQVADNLGEESTILKKKRYGDRKVKIKFSGGVEVKGKNVIIL